MEFKTVACVGAGIIGQSWATLFSSNGLQVNLQDLTEGILKKAHRRIASNLFFLEQNKFLMKGKAESALKRITTTTSLTDAVWNADYVQESVPDNYESKKKVFWEMDAATQKSSILASSSSGLLMSEIQKNTTRPERCVLVHPILPPHLIPLVEIAGGEKTSMEVVANTRDFMVRLGKVPVVLNKEVPGYIVNRLTAAIWREAVSLINNDVASAEDIDIAFCMGIGLRNPIFGPCLRAHVAGGDIESFLEKYAQSYRTRWESMESWISMPFSAKKKVIESVNEMEVIRTKNMDEIERLRDKKLVEILRIIFPKHPFYR
jgi:3-hydroxyacyl-CoA dehydrogenase